jgi:dihydrofolate synthase/folylpolyglutamate synthase
MRMNYDEALAYIYGLLAGERPPLGPARRLDRISRLLDALALRHPPFPVVLVAGTKGKGSTATMLAEILRASGRHVGLYTKPHVSDFRERIRLDGDLVSPDGLAGLVERVAPAVEQASSGPGGRPSYFEVSVALALLGFADAAVDAAVIEVGVGGRDDATNALDPVVSVITPISRDHIEQLGGTLDAIARHKAGIMRAGRPAVVAPQVGVVDATLAQEARTTRAHLVRVEEAASWTRGQPGQGGEVCDLKTGRADYGRLVLGMRGRHQVANAATAVVAAEALLPRDQLTGEAVARGLRSAVLPARFECLDGTPPIVLDVAHNSASLAALRDTLDEYFPGRPVIVVCGMIATHESGEALPMIAGRARLVVITEPDHLRAVPAAALAAAFRPHVASIEVEPDQERAIDRALALAGRDDVVCITGSVYLVCGARGRLLAGRVEEAGTRRVG